MQSVWGISQTLPSSLCIVCLKIVSCIVAENVADSFCADNSSYAVLYPEPNISSYNGVSIAHYYTTFMFTLRTLLQWYTARSLLLVLHLEDSGTSKPTRCKIRLCEDQARLQVRPDQASKCKAMWTSAFDVSLSKAGVHICSYI